MVYDAIGAAPRAWAGHTASAIRAVGEEDGSVVVLPIASLEQHGPHLPTATDTILATAVAHHGAATADEVPALVLPPVWSGYSPHHTPFGGTVTVGFDTMLSLIRDIVTSAVDNGFEAALVLNGHGGNAPLVGAAVSTLGPALPAVDVLGLTYWDLATAAFNEDIRTTDLGGAAHAGEFETSLMLHLRPDLVGEARPVEPREPVYADQGRDMHDAGPLSTYREWDAVSESGIVGDASAASAESGAALLDVLENALADLLREIHAEHR